MDMHIQIISKIEIALLPLSYHELASRLTSPAAVAGLYCLFFLVSGSDQTESIKLNWEIQSRTARTYTRMKNQKKTLVMPSIPLTPVDNRYAPLFFA